MNPVLVREWKSFFRGKSPYYFLMFYGGIHLLILLGVVAPVLKGAVIHYSAFENAGKILAGRLFGTQLFLIAFMFPPLSVRLMTRERDGEILQLLQIVPYGYLKTVCWKLVTSIIIWVFLIAIILPLFLFSLSTGGISVRDLVLLLGLLMAFVFCCGGIGFLFTLIIKRPAYSLAATYFSIFAIAYSTSYLYYPFSIVSRFLSFSF